MKDVTGLASGPLLCSFRNSAACSSACPPISPIRIIPLVVGSSKNTWRQSIKLVPLNGSPPIPTQRVCPRPTAVVWWPAWKHQNWYNIYVRKIKSTNLIGQGSRTRNDSNATPLMDVTGHDADLTFFCRDYTRTVRADESGFSLLQKLRLDANHILLRNTFSDANNKRNLKINFILKGDIKIILINTMNEKFFLNLKQFSYFTVR